MAGNVVGRLVIEMSAGVARLEKDMAAARSSVNSATKSINSAIGVTKNLLGALGVGFTFKAIIDETSRSEQEINRFNALLRITGDQAGLTRLQLESMGKALEDTSHFDDEDILRGQSTFLKFGNIQKDVFTEGMKLAADYAAFTGTEFAAGAQAVGRALQSPTQGLKALQLELGKLTPTQKEHIEKLMEQNKLAEAQGVVLEFVRGKIGGVSKEMNQGFLARTAAMSKEMGNLMEAIGKSFVGDATKSLLGFAVQTLKDMRAIVEDGDWIEKLLGVLAMAGGMRGLTLTKQDKGALRPGEVSGKIGGLSPQTPAKQEPTAEFLEAQRKASEKAREKAAAELKKYLDHELETYRLTVVAVDELAAAEADRAKAAKDEDDEFVKAMHEFNQWNEGQNNLLDQQAQKWKDLIDPMEPYRRELAEIDNLHKQNKLSTEEWFQAVLAASEKMPDAMKKATTEMGEFAKEAARGIQNGFSDGLFNIMQGKFDNMGDRFKLMIDRMVADVLSAKLASAIFGDMDKTGNIGGLIGKGIEWLGGLSAKAIGGPVFAGTPYMVGERGPELFVPSSSGNIVPNGGGNMTVTNVFNISGATDRRSQAQIAAAAGQGVQRALTRNT